VHQIPDKPGANLKTFPRLKKPQGWTEGLLSKMIGSLLNKDSAEKVSTIVGRWIYILWFGLDCEEGFTAGRSI
jgi:hypothetical protein